MRSFGRPFTVGLCFTVKLIYREIVLDVDNATGDGKQQERAAFSSQRLSHCRADFNRSWAAQVLGLKSSAVVCERSAEISSPPARTGERSIIAAEPWSFAVRSYTEKEKPLGSSHITSREKGRKKGRRACTAQRTSLGGTHQTTQRFP